MKLVIYFGLMFISLVVSVLLGYFNMKKTYKLWLSFFTAL
jgi:hypothetical protein